MAREPFDITAEPAPSHEVHDMSRRFCVGVVLTLPVFILEMGRHIARLGLGKLVHLVSVCPIDAHCILGSLAVLAMLCSVFPLWLLQYSLR